MDIAKFSTSSTITTDGRTISHLDSSYPELGTLLIILEVRTTTPPLDAEMLDNVIDTIVATYFPSDHDAEQHHDVDPEAQLERVAGVINKNIQILLDDINPSDIKKNVSLFVGAVIEDNLLFAKTDQIQLLMQHGGNLIPVADDGESSPSDPLLTYVTAGELGDNDAMLMTTDALLDYFSHAKVKKILTEKGARDASVELKTLVEEFAQQTLFQAIIIKNAEQGSAAQTYTKTTNAAQSSISAFNNVEASTGDLLSNSFWLTTKKSIQSLGQNLKRTRKEPTAQTPAQAPREERTRAAAQMRRRQRSPLSQVQHKLMVGLKSVGLIMAWLGQQLAGLGKNLFRQRHTLVKSATDAGKSLPNKIKDNITNTHSRYKALDDRRRNILFGIVALVLILVASVGWGLTRESSSMSREEVFALFDEIEVKRASAEAAILYGNEPQAVSLISEARRLLNSIDAKSGDFKTRKAELATSLFETYKNLQKLEEIDQPVLAADLGTQPDGSIREIKGLSGSGSTFYAYDEANTIYQFNLTDASVTPVGNIPESVEDVLVGEDGELFVYTSETEARIYQLDIANNTADQVAITFTNPASEKVALVPYFSRMYTLDPRERQIFKHQLVGTTYTRGEPWVSDTAVDLSAATDMTIDGNVWVTTSNGELLKLTAGVKEDFTMETLDPPLNSPNIIWTSVDSQYLYILDPPTHRIVILTKEGAIHKQYVSQVWNDLRGLAVNEDETKLYLLSGNNVFEVELE